jgi:hypothetical protein
MKRTTIDTSEYVAPEPCDLRSENPWLAAYRGGAVRDHRARKLRSLAGATAMLLSMLRIGSVASPRRKSPLEPLL